MIKTSSRRSVSLVLVLTLFYSIETSMAESSSEATKNPFSDVVGGLYEEQKALVKELNQLKQEDIALVKEEAELEQAHEVLNENREEIGQAMLRWGTMFEIIKSKEDKVRDKRKALDQQKTQIKDKIALFENLLPSSNLA
ncbi:unnamed protein product [Mucor fragilis]